MVRIKNSGGDMFSQAVCTKLPPPKDSQFSVPIRTPVRVLVGHEAPEKFSLLWDSVILFILGFLKIKEEKNFFFSDEKQKKKKKGFGFYS